MNPIYSHASLKVKRKAEEWEKYDRKRIWLTVACFENEERGLWTKECSGLRSRVCPSPCSQQENSDLGLTTTELNSTNNSNKQGTKSPQSSREKRKLKMPWFTLRRPMLDLWLLELYYNIFEAIKFVVICYSIRKWIQGVILSIFLFQTELQFPVGQ